MSNTKKFSLIALASIFIAGLAGCYNSGPEDKADWITAKISKKLDLDENQKLKLDELKNEVLNVRKETHNERDGHLKQVKEMIKGESLDKAEIKLLLTQKQEIFNKKSDIIIDKLIAFHASLKPEQKQLIINFIEERKEGHGHFGNHRPW